MIATGSALAVFLSCGMAQAQKFALIDMQQAVLLTSDGKKAAAAIDAKFAPVKADIDKTQSDIVAKQTEFAKNRATMSAAAAASVQAQIDSLSTALKRKQEDAQQDLQDEESKQLGGIMPKLQQIINSYAGANQIMFVVDSSASPNNLIYGDGSINITTAIVADYEKAAGAPAAPTPAAAATPKPPAATPKPAATAPKAAPATPRTTAPVK
jgi:Skp family chaperone for outer membrane proteins